jgi:hypothetical protein
VNDVAIRHDRDAKAEPGKLADPASYATGLAHGSGVFQTQLPAVGRALAAWDIDDPPGNADLRTSELMADAAGHVGRSPGITCEVTDPSLDLPGPAGQPDAGRGMTTWFTRPTASAVLPAVTGRRSRLSLRRNTPLANLMVNAHPARAVTGMRTPRKEDAGHD